MPPFKYFSDTEIKNLNLKLVQMLELAREYAQVPFIINSGFRTPKHNAEVGGVPDSAHLKGLAVDLKCETNQIRFIMLWTLLQAGFKRIEISKKHIHVDIDDTKPQSIVWLA